MATILQKANEILAEKNEKILPTNIRAGVQIFEVAGELIELVGEEKLITPTTTEQIITPSEGYNAVTNITVEAVTNEIDENIIAENIKTGVTILGIEGSLTPLDTSDATATASDIVVGKTAYVNGEKIEGTVVEFTTENGNIAADETASSVANTPIVTGMYENEAGEMFVTIKYVQDTIQRAESQLGVNAPTLATVIGLTADKIKSGEVILGVTGTYTGETTETPEESGDTTGDETEV